MIIFIRRRLLNEQKIDLLKINSQSVRIKLLLNKYASVIPDAPVEIKQKIHNARDNASRVISEYNLAIRESLEEIRSAYNDLDLLLHQKEMEEIARICNPDSY